VIRATGRLLAGAAAIAFLSFAAAAADLADPIPVPRLTGRVVDLSGPLTAPEREAIASQLKAFEDARGSQVAVLIVPSLGPETIEEFATRVTDEWKLGRAGVDDGVLLVVALKERVVRIQTGRGVQGVLTDALSRRIIADRITPRFRAGDFAGGISEGVAAILAAVEGEALPPPASSPGGRRPGGAASLLTDNLVWIALFFGPVVALLRRLAGRLFAAAIAGGVAGIGAWIALGSVKAGVIGAVVGFFFGLSLGGSGYRLGGSGGWSSGGGWSGGGGGGFSGGGGGFDGGGASGRW
jgi:uncharacterized protein